MNTTPGTGTPLPPNVLAALAHGDTIEAIKLLRAATGLGLKEAKDAIDAQASETEAQMPAPTADKLPPEVMAALQRGEKVEAIKLLRAATGLGLKESKDLVDAVQVEASTAGDTHLAPGELPRPGNTVWIVVCLVIVCAFAWYFLRGAG